MKSTALQMHLMLGGLLAGMLLAFTCKPAHADYRALSSRGIDLSGHWVLETGASDDAQAMLAERMAREHDRQSRQRRAFEPLRASDVPLIDVDPAVQPGAQAAHQRPWQKRRGEELRRMLGITQTLTIRQSGRHVQIESAQETRRLEAGTRSQVSMPQGQLADAHTGWQGQWFIIERRVKRGPGVVEKFRLLADTGQLEYQMLWSGDTELSGMKLRRIFDRAAPPQAPGAPAAR